MQPDAKPKQHNWLMRILGDVQFWVPLAVLIGGLLLLHSIR